MLKAQGAGETSVRPEFTAKGEGFEERLPLDSADI